MTCIVALETPAGVVMGADRMASTWTTTITLDDPKIFTNGPLLIGACGSIRHGQLLKYSLVVPVDTLSWDRDRWVAHNLAYAIQHTFETHGAKPIKDGVSRGNNALCAVGGRCYELQSDYSFTRAVNGEYAIGSGEEYALGSLHATRGNPDPEARVRAALEAAAEHTPTVAGPFDIEWQATP